MKKLVVMAAAMLASAAVFADVTFSGFVRGGWATNLSDKDDSKKVQFTGTYQDGEVLGAGANTRFNLAWEGEYSGAYVRLQDSTAGGVLDTVKYAYVWGNLFNDVVTVTAGKTKDDWISAGGYADFSFIDGENAVGLFVKPVEGLSIGGGSIVGYGKFMDADNNETINDKTDYFKFGAKSLYGGAKYATDQFSIAVAGQAAGAAYAGVTFSVEDSLSLAFEAAYRTKTFIEDYGFRYNEDGEFSGFGLSFNDTDFANNLTLVEQVEFTGVDKLKIGVVSYQYLMARALKGTFLVSKKDGKQLDDGLAIVVYPYVSFDINETFTVSAEAATWIYDNSDAVADPDGYTLITPALNIHADESATVSVWATLSTDTEIAAHKTGVGVEFTF